MSLQHAINKAFDGTDPDAIKKLRSALKDINVSEILKSNNIPENDELINQAFIKYTKTEEYSWAWNKLAKFYTGEHAADILRKVFRSGFKFTNK